MSRRLLDWYAMFLSARRIFSPFMERVCRSSNNARPQRVNVFMHTVNKCSTHNCCQRLFGPTHEYRSQCSNNKNFSWATCKGKSCSKSCPSTTHLKTIQICVGAVHRQLCRALIYRAKRARVNRGSGVQAIITFMSLQQRFRAASLRECNRNITG